MYHSSIWVWGVIFVKFNMHNISNKSTAFTGQTMPTCMHNMPCNMHAQYAIMMYAHTTCECVLAVCQCAYTKCQHAICMCNIPLCMHSMHACKCMHNIQHTQPKDQSSWISSQGNFPPSRDFGKDFEVAEKPSLLGDKSNDRRENRILSTPTKLWWVHWCLHVPFAHIYIPPIHWLFVHDGILCMHVGMLSIHAIYCAYMMACAWTLAFCACMLAWYVQWLTTTAFV